MKKIPTEDTTRYNVFCIRCNRCWTPELKSPLWWQAKQQATKGFLDALCVTGEKCGCIKKQHLPDAPFRIFGGDIDYSFDIPFTTFIDAVRKFLDLTRTGGYDAYIKGVSSRVQEKLQYPY